MENFYLFFLMSLFFIILPGPDTAIATKNTVTEGRAGGMKTVFGICSALLIHTSAAVIGLSAIIVKSVLLFSIFKYVGAAYLFYLGVKTFWALKKSGGVVDDVANTRNRFVSGSCFKQGFLTDLLNPKVAVLFLTFFPQFVDPGRDTVLPFFIMGATYTIMTAVWLFLYVYLIDYISAFMKKPSTQHIIEGVTGAILIGFGIRLFFEKAH